MQSMYDEFEVINGPEDGTACPVARVPCHLGADSDCTVHIATDPAVQYRHARITAASAGYRFRLEEGDCLEVNGRRVGRMRSRIAREGDIVRAGNTFLVLKCVPEGLANRSRGLTPDSDLMFACGRVVTRLRRLLRMLWRFAKRVAGNVLSLLITVLVLLALLSFFLPGLRHAVTQYLDMLGDYAGRLFRTLQ